jgi:hypothetical protein
MPQRFEAGRVSAAQLLSPRIRNITIAGESLAGLVLEPGADVAIRLLGGDGGYRRASRCGRALQRARSTYVWCCTG